MRWEVMHDADQLTRGKGTKAGLEDEGAYGIEREGEEDDWGGLLRALLRGTQEERKGDTGG